MRLDKTKSLLVILAVGLVALDGWVSWDLYQFQGRGKQGGYYKLALQLAKRSVKALAGEANQGAQAARWDYSNVDAWAIFWKANFTGKEPPKPVPKKPAKPASKPVPKTHEPLSEDVELLSLFQFPGEEGSRPDAYVVLRYKKPVDQAVAMDRAVPSQAAGAQALSIHLLHKGEKLKSPFDAWTLKEILPDGSGAVFVWNGKDKEILKVKEIAAAMRAADVSELPDLYGEEGRGAASRPAGKRAARAGSRGKTPARTRRWRPVKKITQVAPDDWILPREDVRDFGRNPDRWLQSVRLGAHTLPPRARKRHGGQRTGLAIGKVSGKARELGLEEGMILISLNGHPVRTKAEAINVGKKLYKQGVRVFQATVLQYGRERTLIYRLPDGK